MNRSFADVGAFSVGDGVAGGGSGGWAGAVNLTAGDRPLRVRSALVDEPSPRDPRRAARTGAAVRAGRDRCDVVESGPRRAAGRDPLARAVAVGVRRAAHRRTDRCRSTAGRTTSSASCRPASTSWTTGREIWLPIGIHPVIRGLRENHILQVIGRLKDGVTPQAAEAELATFLENWGDRAGIRGVLVDPVTHARGAHADRASVTSRRITRCGCSRCRTRFSATRAA